MAQLEPISIYDRNFAHVGKPPRAHCKARARGSAREWQ